MKLDRVFVAFDKKTKKDYYINKIKILIQIYLAMKQLNQMT